MTRRTNNTRSHVHPAGGVVGVAVEAVDKVGPAVLLRAVLGQGPQQAAVPVLVLAEPLRPAASPR